MRISTGFPSPFESTFVARNNFLFSFLFFVAITLSLTVDDSITSGVCCRFLNHSIGEAVTRAFHILSKFPVEIGYRTDHGLRILDAKYDDHRYEA